MFGIQAHKVSEIWNVCKTYWVSEIHTVQISDTSCTFISMTPSLQRMVIPSTAKVATVVSLTSVQSFNSREKRGSRSAPCWSKKESWLNNYLFKVNQSFGYFFVFFWCFSGSLPTHWKKFLWRPNGSSRCNNVFDVFNAQDKFKREWTTVNVWIPR